MSIFDKIADWISGEPAEPKIKESSPKHEEPPKQEQIKESTPKYEEPQKQEPIKESTPKHEESPKQEPIKESPQKQSNIGNNSIETKSSVIDSIINKLHSNFRGSDTTFERKTLIITITDGMLHETLTTDQDFKNTLCCRLAEEGYPFANVQMECKGLPENHTYTSVSQNVYMHIQSATQPQTTVLRARITCIQGSLQKEEYILDSSDIPSCGVFNIGRGEKPFTYRENYIVIRDEDTLHPDNQYVSRTHAKIQFFQNYGFCLFVENGTRILGSRTRIMRNDAWIEVSNPQVPVSLHDGDLIELAKKVILKFEKI